MLLLIFMGSALAIKVQHKFTVRSLHVFLFEAGTPNQLRYQAWKWFFHNFSYYYYCTCSDHSAAPRVLEMIRRYDDCRCCCSAISYGMEGLSLVGETTTSRRVVLATHRKRQDTTLLLFVKLQHPHQDGLLWAKAKPSTHDNGFFDRGGQRKADDETKILQTHIFFANIYRP